jgi:hypothetical protein
MAAAAVASRGYGPGQQQAEFCAGGSEAGDSHAHADLDNGSSTSGGSMHEHQGAGGDEDHPWSPQHSYEEGEDGGHEVCLWCGSVSTTVA